MLGLRKRRAGIQAGRCNCIRPPNGSRALASLARTLLATAANYEGTGESNDDGYIVDEDRQRTTMLNEAKGIVLICLEIEVADDVAILRDHISLELGEDVDWSKLEGVYDKLVTKIDGFPNSLLQCTNLEAANRSVARPDAIVDVLEREFADPEVLGLAGLLYLRRAESSQSNDREGDFVRATALFRAQAVMEKAFEGAERPVTSYRQARAIIAAASAFERLDPIADLVLDGKRDQLAFGGVATEWAGVEIGGRTFTP